MKSFKITVFRVQTNVIERGKKKNHYCTDDLSWLRIYTYMVILKSKALPLIVKQSEQVSGGESPCCEKLEEIKLVFGSFDRFL